MSGIEKDIRIQGVGSELQGVGRAADGRTLFVVGALPGELVDVRVTKEGARFLAGEVICCHETSADRVTPPCPYNDRCGGCVAQHMSYPLSLKLKAQKVRDALARIGGLKDVQVMETLASPDAWRYRNKAEYACGSGVLGMTERGGHGVVDVRDCLLQREASLAFLDAVRRLEVKGLAGVVTRVNHLGQLMGMVAVPQHLATRCVIDATRLFASVPELASLYLCALSPKPNHALDGSCRLLAGEERLSERMCGIDYALSPHSFFQVNRRQAEVLVSELLSVLALRGDETVADLYCGIGTLTLPLAKAAKGVVGVEIVAPAIEDAKRAAADNHISYIDFVCGDACTALPRLLKKGLKPDAIVVDPPRKGLDPLLVQMIIACGPEKIGYVSCDCATLARDAKLLVESGKYRLEKVQPIDMFPWTEHVEAVARLTKANM